jgi:ComF family protein
MIYPVRCPICGEIVIPKGKRICSRCKEKLHYIKEPRCKKCSKPIEQEEKEYCSDCEHKNFHFIKGFSIWVYNAAIKHSISEFKYHNKKEYAKFYIQQMVACYGPMINELSPDVIVPIPIHRSKYRDRGYNQADILARGLGRELKLQVLSELLIRNKRTLPQKQLSDKERLRNLQNAFQFNINACLAYENKINRVLLVDDIYTTGSTIEACTNILRANGINDIYFITLCIGKGF